MRYPRHPSAGHRFHGPYLTRRHSTPLIISVVARRPDEEHWPRDFFPTDTERALVTLIGTQRPRISGHRVAGRWPVCELPAADVTRSGGLSDSGGTSPVTQSMSTPLASNPGISMNAHSTAGLLEVGVEHHRSDARSPPAHPRREHRRHPRPRSRIDLVEGTRFEEWDTDELPNPASTESTACDSSATTSPADPIPRAPSRFSQHWATFWCPAPVTLCMSRPIEVPISSAIWSR